MKKILCFMAVLIALDQGLKLIIVNNFLDANFVIIPNMFTFRPVQNIYGSWIASILGYRMPLLMSVAVELSLTALFLLVYRYLLFYMEGFRKSLQIYFAITFSGVLCSMIDTHFWGGSWDYIRMFNWFTFDLKDCYLTVTQILLFVIMVTHTPIYNKLSKEEKKRYGFINWIKLGLPTSLKQGASK